MVQKFILLSQLEQNIPGDHNAQPCFMNWMDKILNHKDNWQFCHFENICENVSQEAFLKADIPENVCPGIS